MNGFVKDFKEGRKAGSPEIFSLILKAGRQSFARRLAEDKRRRSEEKSVLNLLLRIGQREVFMQELFRRGKKKTPLDLLHKKKG